MRQDLQGKPIIFEVNATDQNMIGLFGGETPETFYAVDSGRVEVGVTWSRDGRPIVQEVVINDARFVTLIQDWFEEAIIQALPDSFKDDCYIGHDDNLPLEEVEEEEWT